MRPPPPLTQEMIAEQLSKHRFQNADKGAREAMSQYRKDQEHNRAMSVASLREATEASRAEALGEGSLEADGKSLLEQLDELEPRPDPPKSS